MRHLGIIRENEDVLRGSSVVDIASHDGRWAYAAYDAGATHVTGIEGRQELIDNAIENFDDLGVPRDTNRFIQGDAHGKLLGHEARRRRDVPRVLNHTSRYTELFKGIKSTQAEHVIVDTRVLKDVDRPLVEFRAEGTGHQAKAVRDRYTMSRRVLSSVPAEQAVVLMLDVAGYEVEHRTDRNLLLAERPRAPRIAHYTNGTRVTFRCRKKRHRRLTQRWGA